MNPHLKKILTFMFICLPNTIIHSSDEYKQGPQAAHSSSSSSSTAATIKKTIHPLAKIFPLELTHQKEINAPYAKVSLDLKYILSSRTVDFDQLYDIDTNSILIDNLDPYTLYGDDFNLMTIRTPQGQNDKYLYDIYTVQEKIANPNAQPFFSVLGHNILFSPNGKYVFNIKFEGNEIIHELYDIQSHEIAQRRPLLDLKGNASEKFRTIKFSPDSKKIINKKESYHRELNAIQLIDIAALTSKNPHVKSAVFTRDIYAALSDNCALSASRDFKYVTKNNNETTSVYDVDTKINNPDAPALFTFSNPSVRFYGKAQIAAITEQNITKVYEPQALATNAQTRALAQLPGVIADITSDEKFFLIFTPYNHDDPQNITGGQHYIFNSSNKEITPIDLVGNSKIIFSDNDQFMWPNTGAGVNIYDLENKITLFHVKQEVVGLNKEKGRLVTKNRTKGLVFIYDVNFLNSPEFQKIVEGKLSLSQLTFIALLNKYYGNPISLAHIVQAENMPKHAVNTILRSTLASFPEIIKQAIIKTYNITDASDTEQQRDDCQLSSYQTLFQEDNR